MRIFLTGATGFIGSRILPELIAAGNEVVGLVRSEEGAQRIAAAGARAWVAGEAALTGCEAEAMLRAAGADSDRAGAT